MKHLIKYALVVLAATAAYFVFQFVSQVADWYVALLAAGSLVGTYIGLAGADIPPAQRGRAVIVARAAMGIEAAYGFLYVLSLQNPEVFAHSPTAPLSLWLSVPLAALHGASFSVLAYFVSLFVVHERGAPAQSGTLTIAEQRDLVIVETLEKITAQLGTHAAPQLTDDGAELVQVGARRISERELSRRLGTPLSTLRRQLAQKDES